MLSYDQWYRRVFPRDYFVARTATAMRRYAEYKRRHRVIQRRRLARMRRDRQGWIGNVSDNIYSNISSYV